MKGPALSLMRSVPTAAHIVTGTWTGHVTDSPGADTTGEFVVSGIVPIVHVEPGQRLVMEEVRLEVGNVTETISVTAEMGTVVAAQRALRRDFEPPGEERHFTGSLGHHRSLRPGRQPGR